MPKTTPPKDAPGQPSRQTPAPQTPASPTGRPGKTGRWVLIAVMSVLFLSFLDLRGIDFLPTNPLRLLHEWSWQLPPDRLAQILGGLFFVLLVALVALERRAKPFQDAVFMVVGSYLTLVFAVEPGRLLPRLQNVYPDALTGSLFLVMWGVLILGLAQLLATTLWSTVHKRFTFWGPRWWER